MSKSSFAAPLILALWLTPLHDIQAVESVETFIAFDKSQGELPEGVAWDRTGNFYVTLAPRGEILKVDRWGAHSTFATLGTPPFLGPGALGLVTDLEGNVYVAMATLSPDSHGVWRISPSGVAHRIPGSEAIGFPNALTFDEVGQLYVTDSLNFTPQGPKGRVWTLSPGGVFTVWSEGPLFDGLVNPFANPIGANGIAYRRGRIVVANTTKRLLVEIPVLKSGAAGAASILARMDDFLPPEALPPLLDGVSVDARGNVYALVVGQNKLARLPPDGSSLTVLADINDGLQIPASAAFGTTAGRRSTLYLTNFTFLQGFDNAAVLSIDVGVAGAPILGRPVP